MKTPEEISKSDALWRRSDVDKAFGASLLPGAKKFAQNLRPIGSTLRNAGAQVGGAAGGVASRVGQSARPAIAGARAGAQRVGSMASANRKPLAIGGAAGATAGVAMGANKPKRPKTFAKSWEVTKSDKKKPLSAGQRAAVGSLVGGGVGAGIGAGTAAKKGRGLGVGARVVGRSTAESVGGSVAGYTLGALTRKPAVAAVGAGAGSLGGFAHGVNRSVKNSRRKGWLKAGH